MTVVGYARVSSADQNLDLQLEKLEAAGAVKIFAEKISGARMEGREQLQAMIDYIRPGDLVLVTKLDRLGRSLPDLLATVASLTEAKGCEFRVLDQHGIDTTTPNGRLMLQLIAAVAEFERAMIRERQLEGITRAKAKGRYKNKGGRPKVDDAAVLAALLHPFANPSDVARQLGVSRASVYRVMGRQKAKSGDPDQTDLEDLIPGPARRPRARWPRRRLPT